MAETAAVAFGAAETSVHRDSSAAVWPTGSSAAIRRVNESIRQVAAFDSNVLVLGESGTGKEVVARAIHEASPRRRRAFVPINCGAIPSELLESELFGHEKGAFTGALTARKGRFEMAEGGTVFLDEIGDMNPAMQVKLLRVLQERVFERVGSCVSQRCDVRIIAATHRNLEDAIARGTFREDLYYRLNVVPIEMPALRDRTEDLPHLIAALAERIAQAGRPQVQFSAETLAALRVFRWPGNVRELANLIERMAVQCGRRAVMIADLPARYRPADWESVRDTPTPEALIASVPAAVLLDPALSGWINAAGPPAGFEPEERGAAADGDGAAIDADEPAAMDPALADELLAQIPDGFDLRNYLESLEQRLIERAMQSAGGTVARAARLLGLRRTTLVEKLRKYSGGGETLVSES
ncbi:MAG: sigma-54 interaction domain-containing protein [Steroidobacteraceae bacterium]